VYFVGLFLFITETLNLWVSKSAAFNFPRHYSPIGFPNGCQQYCVSTNCMFVYTVGYFQCTKGLMQKYIVTMIETEYRKLCSVPTVCILCVASCLQQTAIYPKHITREYDSLLNTLCRPWRRNGSSVRLRRAPDFSLTIVFLDHVTNTQKNSGFCREVDEICALLVQNAASSGNAIRLFFFHFLTLEDGYR
jgi:hypothetical protein